MSQNAIAFPVPDISRPGASRIDAWPGAVVVPPREDERNPNRPRLGVFSGDGSVIPEALTFRGQAQINIPPAIPPSDEIDELPGTWLFLGMLYAHFGHLVAESIARFWALDHLKERVDGVVFVPVVNWRTQHTLKRYTPLLNTLGLDLPARSLDRPTRVERLLVPTQGFGLRQMIDGSPEFRAFMGAHAGVGVEPKGAEKIYISRTCLSPSQPGVLGEALMQKWLFDEGYVTFHPQQHDAATQIAQYKAARKIIALDSSPLHLLAFVGNPGQHVGIIARGAEGHERTFARQIEVFSGARVTTFDHIRRIWTPNPKLVAGRRSWADLDFEELAQALDAEGLITDFGDWWNLTPKQAATEAARAGRRMGKKFRPMPERARDAAQTSDQVAQ